MFDHIRPTLLLTNCKALSIEAGLEHGNIFIICPFTIHLTGSTYEPDFVSECDL